MYKIIIIMGKNNSLNVYEYIIGNDYIIFYYGRNDFKIPTVLVKYIIL